MRSRMLTAWDDLYQCINAVIDTPVGQWRMRLHVCVKEKGGHFQLDKNGSLKG